MSHHDHHHGSTGNLKVAFFLNATFTLVEIAGGLYTNSIAILSDALHDAGDTASLGLAWYFDRLSRKGRTPQHTYGYKRFRLLGGLVTGLVLVIGLTVVLYHAVARLLSPEAVDAGGMAILAILGIVVNGAAVLRVRQGTSLTEKVVSWHLLEDTLGWAAVLVGALVMTRWDIPILDPILSIGISIFVLWNVARNLKDVAAVFLQTTPDGFDIDAIERQIAELPRVLASHHSHSWSLDGESHVFSTHLIMHRATTRQQIVAAKEHLRSLLNSHGFEHVTIDIELDGEPCSAPTSHP